MHLFKRIRSILQPPTDEAKVYLDKSYYEGGRNERPNLRPVRVDDLLGAKIAKIETVGEQLKIWCIKDGDEYLFETNFWILGRSRV